MDIKYLETNEIIQIHIEIMEKDEDTSVLNPNQLELTIDRIQWSIYNEEEDFFDKCAIIFRDIVSGHIFFDGNFFLRKNGYDIELNNNDKMVSLKRIKDILIKFFKKTTS